MATYTFPGTSSSTSGIGSSDSDTYIINGTAGSPITGVMDAGDGADTITGQYYNYEYFYTGSGDDYVELDYAVKQGSGEMVLDDGNDTLILSNSDVGKIDAGADDDYIELNNVTGGGAVYGGAGDDTLIITDSDVGRIYLSAGLADVPDEDYLSLTNSTTGRIFVGNGADTISIDHSDILGNIDYAGGDADGPVDANGQVEGNTITISNGSYVEGAIRLEDGAGDARDTLIITDSTVGTHIITSAGNDTVVLNNAHVGVNGGAGDGSLGVGDDDDTVTISNGSSVAGSVDLDAGNDTLALSDSTIAGGVNGGAGNDTITLSNAVVGGTINGNDDEDTFIISAVSSDTDYRIDGGGGGSDFDVLDLSAFDTSEYTITYTSSDKENGYVSFTNGANITFYEIENVICFGPDTLIATICGEVRAADLSVGDKVLTFDNGYQPIRWIGQRHLSALDLALSPNLRPVRIRAGALGEGMPERDLIVSPQHRVLVRGPVPERMFGTREILVAAKQLLELDGFEVATDLAEIDYIHFLFDAHQIVWSNGAPTESLFTGPEALKTIAPEQRVEIFAIFPELETADVAASDRFAPARLLVPGRRARSAASRLARNGQTPIVGLDGMAPAGVKLSA